VTVAPFRTVAALALAWAALLFSPAAAQQRQPAAPQLPRIDRYYEKPFDVVTFLRAWEKAGRLGADAVLGFLAGVFTKHPKEVARMADVGLERAGQIIIVQALRFAQKTPEARAFTEKWGWSKEDIANIAPVAPLAQTRPEQPNHFDTLWGAAFATGDAAYVRPIYDYYAGVTREPDIEISQRAGLRHSWPRPDVDGGVVAKSDARAGEPAPRLLDARPGNQHRRRLLARTDQRVMQRQRDRLRDGVRLQHADKHRHRSTVPQFHWCPLRQQHQARLWT